MAFSSIVFLLYFLPVFLLGYHLTPTKGKNIFLLVASIIFYSWGAPVFIFVILGTTFFDFHLVKWMSASNSERNRRIWLILSLSLNIGLLFYFKYCNFFVENINVLLEEIGFKHINFTKVILPIGISFYTFESITYVVDVYRGIHKPLKRFWDYQLYIILFPKLIAGPIIRYHQISDQLEDRTKNDTIDNKITGLVRFVIGLSKKVLIANVLAETADKIFSQNILEMNSCTAWVGIIAYTFQIYFDFSGYSDMAIGLGKILGFKFPENFDNPYTSQSITEFWRRWHMTLGAWMKNYLYIPLGGSHVQSNWRLYLNLGIVFLASGFWHGASWNFILWGAYHGAFLILERLFLLKFYARIGKLFSILLSFNIIAIGWVFFRIEHLSDALSFIGRMFSFNNSFQSNYLNNNQFNFILIVAIFFAFITVFKFGKKSEQFFYTDTVSVTKSISFFILITLLMILCIASITGFGFNPFIYFRF